VGNIRNELPFDYGTMNLYNYNRSPSTVHVKNTRLRAYFRKYLFQKAISVFDWVLPEEWDHDYFLYTLYGAGYIAVVNTDQYGTICQHCTLGGYNLYYHPSYAIITNPLIRNTITANIDIDCAVIKLMPDYSSIMDIVGYYADMLALSAESAGVNLVNVKTGTVFGAENKQKAESYKKMYDVLASGEPAVVIDKSLLADDGKPTWFPFTQNVKESYVTSDILSDMHKIEMMFDTMIGIPNANTEKRERLVTDEVNANNVETSSLASLWMKTIKRDIEKANSMFGLSISVDWRVKPDFSVEGVSENE
jgi:hypothetical protein